MPNTWNDATALWDDPAVPWDGAAARIAKFYGSDNYPEPAPFKWSRQWEDEFARRRMEAERRERADDAEDDKYALAAWQKAEDDDLLLAAASIW